jgi:protein tyrosine phosphatase (PTP) superfamily phosphohydrolase (DUF442 family)
MSRAKKFVWTAAFCVLLMLVGPGFAARSEIRVRPSDWAQPVIGSELENWYKVDDRLYRSEQPSRAAFRAIENYGIRSVLNLRSHHSDTAEAQGTDLRLYRVEMHAGNVTTELILSALEIIRDEPGPILVHCWHGSDRTGAVVAAYRVVFQKWSREKAVDEMVNGGFGYHSTYGNLPDLIRKLDPRVLRGALGLD